jgi:putative endonuclease
MSNWTLYILKCADDTLYTGITNDLEKRISDHEAGNGAKYTRGRGPLKLVYNEDHKNRSVASKREYEVKKFTRVQKETLIKRGR